MTPKDWSDLSRLLVAGALKTGEMERAKDLVCKLAILEVQGEITGAGFKAALEIICPETTYRAVEARRILADEMRRLDAGEGRR